MLITKLLNQYRDLVKYMMKLSGCAKINKSIRNNVIEMIFLFMVIPGRINFLQLGRFGRKSEQCYRQTFELSKSPLTVAVTLASSGDLMPFHDGVSGSSLLSHEATLHDTIPVMHRNAIRSLIPFILVAFL